MAPTLLLSPTSSSCKLRRVTVAGSYNVNRRRNTPVFTVILLVLSQNVWNTLQCGTSSPSMKNRPILQVTPEEVENEGEFLPAVDELGNNEMVEDTGDRNYGSSGGLVGVPGKKDRNQYHQNQQDTQIIRLCSSRLLDALKTTCGKNNFNSPLIRDYESTTTDQSLSDILKMASKRSVKTQGMLQRRLPRNVVNDCCYNHCSLDYMRSKFCKDQSKIPTTQRTTTVQTQTSSQPQYPAAPPSTSQEYNPALYTSPLANLLRYMNSKFSHKIPRPVEESSNVNNMASVEGANEGDMGEFQEGERGVLLPQARIQDNPSLQAGQGYQRSRQASKFHQRQQGNGNGAHSRQGFGNSEPGTGISASANEGNGASFTNFPSQSFTNHLGGYNHHHQHRPSANNNLGASSSAYFDRGLGTHTMPSFSNPQQKQEVNENVQRTSTNNVHTLPQPEPPKGRGVRLWPVMDDESMLQIAEDLK